MQEEVEQRTLTLVINGTKFSGRVLKSAVSKFVAFCRNQKAKKVNVHPKGKQSVKQLTQQGQGVNTMEIDDANLRQFERIARKYGVDYAVRRDTPADTPRFLVFFKAATPMRSWRRSGSFQAPKSAKASARRFCKSCEILCRSWARRRRKRGSLSDEREESSAHQSAYVVLGLVCTNLGESWRMADGADASEKILSLFGTLPSAFGNPMPSMNALDLCVGLVCGLLLRLAVYLRGKNAKKYRHGYEYGAARWGTAEDIRPYVDPVFKNNIILTQTERLTMNSRPKDPKTARNKNVLIVGGSGSGKTRYFIKPSLMQCHSSYVVTDPKGQLVLETGRLLERAGYEIRVLNTINFKKSMRYNPFAYIHSEKDILKLVTCLITNTTGQGKSGDEFWTNAEKLLYTALIGYIHHEAPPAEQNFASMLEMLNSMEVHEDDENFKNRVDYLMEDLERRKPGHFATRQYAKFKLAAGKTAKSILVSCGARLSPFDIAELREVTAYDELSLDTIGIEKRRCFSSCQIRTRHLTF